jgi:hypothetical protein
MTQMMLNSIPYLAAILSSTSHMFYFFPMELKNTIFFTSKLLVFSIIFFIENEDTGRITFICIKEKFSEEI